MIIDKIRTNISTLSTSQYLGGYLEAMRDTVEALDDR